MISTLFLALSLSVAGSPIPPEPTADAPSNVCGAWCTDWAVPENTVAEGPHFCAVVVLDGNGNFVGSIVVPASNDGKAVGAFLKEYCNGSV